ncbi:hypothetical protein NW762_013550 [Fusarium torreyae]|uniref:Uncharacterized protein n=1 Tax=Fusarium torreyae TaxID=1237075 RepID=A0A9W8RNL3_9HYPO|nr:hypothetical protein NW762_013550 [Fusarium torreyae]
MNNGQNNNWRRPQRPYMQDSTTRAIFMLQDMLRFQQQQMLHMQAMLAQQEMMIMAMAREIHLLRLEVQEVRDRMAPGLGGSSVGSGTTRGDGPMTPNEFYHYTHNLHHILDTSEYTNL